MKRCNFTLLTFWLLSSVAFAQSTNDISPLQPALPEIPPTLWEQHRLLIVLLAAFVIALVIAAIWWLLQPKPSVSIPIEIQTRRELEALRQRPEDGETLSKITRCIRRYLVSAFGLPQMEMVSRDFCRTILTNEKIGPELSSRCAEFLLRCDERKFAPSDAPPLTGTAEHALQIVDLGEVRRAGLRQTSARQTAQPA